jgi:hypothetical protein
MARPPKYATKEDKPVSVTFRIPRDLYDQAQQHAKRRQTTLTELVCEGLQMRLETPTDPRDILVMQNSAVMQELRQMIAEEVQAALATQRSYAPTSAPRRKPKSKGKAGHYGNAVSAHVSEPARKGGRPRSAVGQQILALLQDHPEGLRAEQIRGYLTPDKPIGDTLSGMKRLGTVQTRGQGKAVRYFIAAHH